MAVSVTASEARIRFGRLLDRVLKGEEIVVTRHDKPVARTIPVGRPAKLEVRAAAAGLRDLRRRLPCAANRLPGSLPPCSSLWSKKGAGERHLRRRDQPSFQGVIRSTPVAAKSVSLRVTTARRCRRAVAAIKPSIAGMFPGRAMRRPHSPATPASIGRTRSSNQSGRSVSSHATIRARRRPSGSFSIPLRISPNVRTLTNKVSGGAASNHSDTCCEGRGLTSSERMHVSTRKLTGLHRALQTGHVRCSARCRRAVKPGGIR